MDELLLRQYGFEEVELPRGHRRTYSEARSSSSDCVVETTKREPVRRSARNALDRRTLKCAVGGKPRYTADASAYRWGKTVPTEEAFEPAEVRERLAQRVWARRRIPDSLG